MSPTPSDPLDRLLRQWADQSAPDARRLEDLQRAILARWEEEQPAVAAAKTAVSGGWRRMLAAACLAAAALAATIAGIAWHSVAPGRPGDVSVAPETEQPPDPMRLSDAELAEKALLHEELVSLFNTRFAWLAETAEGVEIGVGERPGAADAPAIALRLAVERRPADQSRWETLWTADVVARSEEVVRLAPASRDVRELRLWAYALPDGMVAVDTGLALRGLGVERLEAEELQRDGKLEVIYTSRNEQHEVRVLQAAAVLPARQT